MRYRLQLFHPVGYNECTILCCMYLGTRNTSLFFSLRGRYFLKTIIGYTVTTGGRLTEPNRRRTTEYPLPPPLARGFLSLFVLCACRCTTCMPLCDRLPPSASLPHTVSFTIPFPLSCSGSPQRKHIGKGKPSHLYCTRQRTTVSS